MPVQFFSNLMRSIFSRCWDFARSAWAFGFALPSSVRSEKVATFLHALGSGLVKGADWLWMALVASATDLWRRSRVWLAVGILVALGFGAGVASTHKVVRQIKAQYADVVAELVKANKTIAAIDKTAANRAREIDRLNERIVVLEGRKPQVVYRSRKVKAQPKPASFQWPWEQ